MKERIELQDHYTEEDCKANPHKYYVFGDNLVHQGTGGQAVIRYCPNAIGIPTKRLPSMADNAFFSDKPDEFRKVSMFLARLNLLYVSDEEPIIVLPSAGIGTGRAQLKERSPQIYKLIDEFFRIHFEVEIMP